MIILLAGASHTGKTHLAQQLLEKYHYPYLSIDHLKMGLIRSGVTRLTVTDDDALTEFLWPIVREMIKTAVENEQNLIIEGCYIPFDWQDSFTDAYLKQIKYYCLIMSAAYIQQNFSDIKKYADAVEKRLDDAWCTQELLLEENNHNLKMCRQYCLPYILIDGEYKIAIEQF